jgi:hypothetical protein
MDGQKKPRRVSDDEKQKRLPLRKSNRKKMIYDRSAEAAINAYRLLGTR